MQKSPHYFFALFISLLVVCGCSQKEISEELASSPTPELFCIPTTSCASLGSNTNLLMSDWAPYMGWSLDPGKTESPSAAHTCTPTNATTTRSITWCWPSYTQYSGCVAGDEVCRLAAWARSERPVASGSNSLVMNKWYISSYTHTVTPNSPCANSCSSPIPLTTVATYTKYRCELLMETAPQDLKVAGVRVVRGPIDPAGTSDGLLEFSVYRNNPDNPQTPQVRLIIKNPSDQIIQEVLSTPGSDPENSVQLLTFEIEDYSITECPMIFEWI